MKTIKMAIVALGIALLSANAAQAQGLSDIFGALGNMIGGNSQSGNGQTSGNGGDNILGNLLEGVFSSSNITVRDMAGVWTANGPAVCFQSENFLKQAGGKAAAAVVGKKISPYYNTLGLNGAVITIETDGTFSLKTKMVTLKGDITPVEGKKGVFSFNFSMLGMRLMAVNTYVEKTSKSMSIMFDATKLVSLLSAISKVVNIQTLSAITKILDSYDGLCVGFRTDKTGSVQGETTGSDSGLSGLGTLLNGLGLGGSNQNNNGANNGSGYNSNTNNNSNSDNSAINDSVNGNASNSGTQSQESVNESIDRLRNILGGSKRK